MIYTVTLNPVLDRTLSVPAIVFDDVLRATDVRFDWGGKGFNVSRALRLLGGESMALGFTGGGTGRMLERGLAELGIATELTPIQGETRTNVVIAEEGTGRYIKVNEAGPTILPAEREALLEKVRRLAKPGALWVLSGSLPPGVPAGFYALLVETIQSRGGLVFLDASGEPFRLGCAAGPFLVKPNTAEAAEALGISIREREGDWLAEDLRAAGEAFLRQGITYVALSLGAGGLWFAGRDASCRLRPPKIRLGNPTGAGDSLLAGMVWALARGLSPREAAHWGVAAGSAAAMHAGTGVGTFEEVNALTQQVAVEEEG
jgi:1-phosphofructokinase family hexose kinase